MSPIANDPHHQRNHEVVEGMREITRLHEKDGRCDARDQGYDPARPSFWLRIFLLRTWRAFGQRIRTSGFRFLPKGSRYR